jgi:putative hydrolase of the HAD superfamily
MLIIFDLDDTLIDTFGCSVPVKSKVALQEMITQGLDVDLDEAYGLLMEIHETSKNGTEAFTRFLERVGGNLELLTIAKEAYYSGEQLDFPIHTLVGAYEVIEKLSKEHSLVIVSYGVPEEQYGKMKKAGIDQSLFRKIIISEEYDKTEHYKEFEGEDVLVVGDKYETDLVPARNLGMKTVHMKWGRGKVNVPKLGEVDYIISSLGELLNIVEGLSKK